MMYTEKYQVTSLFWLANFLLRVLFRLVIPDVGDIPGYGHL